MPSSRCPQRPLTHRARGEAFVETVLAAFPPMPFDLLTARAHARIWVQVAGLGAHCELADGVPVLGDLAAGDPEDMHFGPAAAVAGGAPARV